MKTASGPLSLVPRQIGHELTKLFARPRTHIGFGMFLLFEIVILSLLQLPKPKASYQRLLEANGYLFEHYFSGLTLAVVIVTSAAFLLGALFLALVSGDIVAKEVEDGTMRMILNRPVPRAQLLGVKWFSCVVYTFTLLFFIGGTSLVVGLLFQGWGGLFVYSPLSGVFAIYEGGEGMARMALAIFWLGLVSCVISSLGFFFSCLPVKPAAASIVTLAIFFADFVMSNLPQFSDHQAWFLSFHMRTWSLIFEPVIPWARVLESLLWLGAVNASCLFLGVLIFSQRDFKS